jgi:hypothetical protein
MLNVSHMTCRVQANSVSSSLVDPFLKLHIGISLMMTVKADVVNEMANGTSWYLKAVILKSHMANVPLSTFLLLLV